MKTLFEDSEDEGIPTWEESVNNTIFNLEVMSSLIALMTEVEKTRWAVEQGLALVNEQFDKMLQGNLDIADCVNSNRYKTMAMLRQRGEQDIEKANESVMRFVGHVLEHHGAMN